ncbi:unnamed protein product, partial [Ixodes pacificus]
SIRKNNGAGTQFSVRDRNRQWPRDQRCIRLNARNTCSSLSCTRDIRAPSGSDAARGPGAPPGSGVDPCPRAVDFASPGTGCRRGPTARNGRDPAASGAGQGPEVFGTKRPDC